MQLTKHIGNGIYPDFKTQGRRHQKSITGVSVAPKRTKVFQILKQNCNEIPGVSGDAYNATASEQAEAGACAKAAALENPPTAAAGDASARAPAACKPINVNGKYASYCFLHKTRINMCF